MLTASAVSTVPIFTIHFTGTVGRFMIRSSTILIIIPHGTVLPGLLHGTGDGDITGGTVHGTDGDMACMIRITPLPGVIPGMVAVTMDGTMDTGVVALGVGAIATMCVTEGEQPPVPAWPEV